MKAKYAKEGRRDRPKGVGQSEEARTRNEVGSSQFIASSPHWFFEECWELYRVGGYIVAYILVGGVGGVGGV